MATPDAAGLSLGQALTLADAVSPGLKAAKVHESESKEAAVSQSGYFPSHGVDAVDSTRFPGSVVGSMVGFVELVGSPYREGVSVDARS